MTWCSWAGRRAPVLVQQRTGASRDRCSSAHVSGHPEGPSRGGCLGRQLGSASRALRLWIELLVAAVAHGPVAGALAGAEPGARRLIPLPFNPCKPFPLLRAVAERPVLPP